MTGDQRQAPLGLRGFVMFTRIVLVASSLSVAIPGLGWAAEAGPIKLELNRLEAREGELPGVDGCQQSGQGQFGPGEAGRGAVRAGRRGRAAARRGISDPCRRAGRLCGSSTRPRSPATGSARC